MDIFVNGLMHIDIMIGFPGPEWYPSGLSTTTLPSPPTDQTKGERG